MDSETHVAKKSYGSKPDDGCRLRDAFLLLALSMSELATSQIPILSL